MKLAQPFAICFRLGRPSPQTKIAHVHKDIFQDWIIDNYCTSQLGATRFVGCTESSFSNKRVWSNCFIKSHQEILLDFADFALLEQPVGNLMVSNSRTCYNGLFSMAAKPIKSLELHYTMIHFFMTIFSLRLIEMNIFWLFRPKKRRQIAGRDSTTSLLYTRPIRQNHSKIIFPTKKVKGAFFCDNSGYSYSDLFRINRVDSEH